MDEMKMILSTNFMKKIVTKLISKAIFKKYGYHVDIDINEIEVVNKDGKVHLHANVDAEINNEEFKQIMKNVGI